MVSILCKKKRRSRYGGCIHPWGVHGAHPWCHRYGVHLGAGFHMETIVGGGFRPGLFFAFIYEVVSRVVSWGGIHLLGARPVPGISLRHPSCGGIPWGYL